jgi:hypothetical protein
MDIFILIEWFQDHWKDLISIWGSVVLIASIIVKWTPTLKDDDALLGIIKWVAKYLALNTNAPTSRPQ